MPINYTVRADIIDLRADAPQPIDDFLIDTNVWGFLVYTRMAGGPHAPTHAKITAYSSFVNQALANGSGLKYCGLTLAELAHLIEKTEREIYIQANPGPPPRTKEFRHNFPAERANVVTEIRSAWSQVTAMSSPAEALIDEALTDAVIVRLQTEALDVYDLFLAQAASAFGINQIITDDGDYCGIPGIQMFTSNQTVVAAAQAQGRLVIR